MTLSFYRASVVQVSPGQLEQVPCDVEEVGYKNDGDSEYDWLPNEEQQTLQIDDLDA